MTLRSVDFKYPLGGFEFHVSSVFKIEDGRRELIHHEIPDYLMAMGVSYTMLDRLADEAADKEGIIA